MLGGGWLNSHDFGLFKFQKLAESKVGVTPSEGHNAVGCLPGENSFFCCKSQGTYYTCKGIV